MADLSIGRWTSETLSFIAEKEKVTSAFSNFFTKGFQPEGTTSQLVKSNLPNFDVIEVIPDRSKGKELYFLSGTPAMLAMQESLFIAIYDAIHNAVDSDLDLKSWITEFENCFPSFSIKTAPYDYALQHPWGVSISERPLVRILAQVKSSFPWFTCQFFPSRANVEESYIISGSTHDCINQIMGTYNQWLILQTRDMGQWVGYPIDEELRRYPRNYATLRFSLTTDKQGRTGKSTSYKRKTGYLSYSSPAKELIPFRRVQVTVPIVNITNIKYNTLRQVCGGSKGLNIGYWMAIREVGLGSSVGFAEIRTRGSSYEEAIKNMDGFLSLLDKNAFIKSPKPTYLRQSYESDSIDGYAQKLNSYTVYPSKVTITSSTITKATKNAAGRNTRIGARIAKSITLSIGLEKEPYKQIGQLNNFLLNLNN